MAESTLALPWTHQASNGRRIEIDLTRWWHFTQPSRGKLTCEQPEPGKRTRNHGFEGRGKRQPRHYAPLSKDEEQEILRKAY
jgi:hypothetical protein